MNKLRRSLPMMAAAVALVTGCVSNGVRYEVPKGQEKQFREDLTGCRNQAALQRAGEGRAVMEVGCMQLLGYKAIPKSG